jgi:hypothetical protein
MSFHFAVTFFLEILHNPLRNKFRKTIENIEIQKALIVLTGGKLTGLMNDPTSDDAAAFFGLELSVGRV